jgi:hypothetical protein
VHHPKEGRIEKALSERIKKLLSDVESGHCKEVPVVLVQVLAAVTEHLVYFGSLSNEGVSRLAHFGELGKAKVASSAEICSWILPLEPDIYPILAYPILYLTVRHEQTPQLHKLLLHFGVLLIVDSACHPC